MKRIPNVLFIIGLLVLSIALHLLFIWHPAEVVFDEVHYGKTVNGYLTGQYFFTGHPPLGSQLITLGAWLAGYRTPQFPFDHIGEPLNPPAALALRFASSLAGSLIPLVAYLFLRIIGVPASLSFLAGALVALDNAILTQTRFILVDPFLILFGLLGVCAFFAARKKNYDWRFLLAASAMLTLSIAVKWNGLGFSLLVGAVMFYDLIRALFAQGVRETLLGFYKPIAILALFSPLVYLGVFALHFYLLENPGTGDVFMSKEFLSGEKNLIEKTWELNKTNYETNVKGLTADHPYASKWYTWPLMLRPIYYWAGQDARIYLLGNPVIWWASSGAVVASIFLFLLKTWRRDPVPWILLAGYLASLLPFIGVKRVVFLYHYLTPLIFAIMILVYVISKMKYSRYMFVLLFVSSIIAFLYFAPLTYGLKLTPEQYENRVWLSTWR